MGNTNSIIGKILEILESILRKLFNLDELTHD